MFNFRLIRSIRANQPPTWFKALIAMCFVTFTFYTYLLTVADSPDSRLPFLPLPYLINTSTCQLKDYPMFDGQTRLLFKSHANEDFDCNWHSWPPFHVRRINFTWIEIDFPVPQENWKCFAVEIKKSDDDKFEFGSKVGPLGRLTNFANNLTSLTEKNVARWDVVKVICNGSFSRKPYTAVVPLIQYYHNINSNKTKARANVLLLGIDSVSRLNFLRHMTRTKRFVENHGFVPMYGYHKVGENSFPNVIPMLTGHHHTYYCNKLNANCAGDNFKFDNISLIFNDYARQGFLTTFIEDMPKYGFFTYYSGGFVKQVFDYYLRPVNLAIIDDLYSSRMCYQGKLENEMYWEYIYDQLKAFRERDNQSFISFAHVSSLTHDELNYIGYADKPFHHLLEQIFSTNLNHNTVIMLYSDHAIRFGPSMKTRSHFYESSLPFFYFYVPDSLVLSERNASQLRDIVRVNQHQLTSHFDLHATMLHLLNGQVPQSEPYGRSLLELIPQNRTCDMAGIPPDSCLCNSFQEIQITYEVIQYSEAVVAHMNQMMSSYGNYCVPLTLGTTDQAFQSFDRVLNESYREVHFTTRPNGANLKATVRLGQRNEVLSVDHITRNNRYGEQSHCVKSRRDLVQFCLCWNRVHSQSSQSESKLHSFIGWIGSAFERIMLSNQTNSIYNL